MNSEFMKTGLLAGGFTLVLLITFVGLYWIVRGFPPASRSILETETPSDLNIPTDKAHLLFFYTNWCPYSQEAQPAIKSLETILQEYTYGGKKVDIQHVDCERDRKTCSQFKVDSYPSYKLQTTTKTYEYLGPPTVSVLREFLTKALGSELPVGGPTDKE